MKPLRVEVLVPAEMHGKILSGAKAIVVPEISPESRLEARVEAPTPFINAASGTFRVRLELVNSRSRESQRRTTSS